MPFVDLRDFISSLADQGEILRIQTPVDPHYEIAAYIRKASDTDGPALFFEKVKGFDIPVIAGIFASRRRALMALETVQDQVLDKFLKGIQLPLPTKLVQSGACQEVVKTGSDANLHSLPIPTFSDKDGGPYITLGVTISKDPENGTRNASIYRLEVKSKDRLGVLAEGQHLAFQLRKAEAQNKPLEIAIVVGCAPAILFASQWKGPYGIDELTLAGSICGQPIEVVKCKTVDLEVPASAEIVIEGHILPHIREIEGPFGEVSGYMSEASPKPVIVISAITHRHQPIYHAALSGVPTTENHVIRQFPVEATYYAELKGKFPGVSNVHFPSAGAGAYLVVIAMKQYNKYESRNVIAHMLGTTRNKLIVVVDDDVNVFNMEHVMWAITTRCQFDQDVIIFPRLFGSRMDPSALEWGVACGMGIDATRPFGQPFPEVVTVSGVDKVPDLHALLATQRSNKQS